MISLEEAQGRILALVRPLGSELVPLVAAARRVLAEPVVAPHDLPTFDNSAMDGYAVQAADVASATPSHPSRLRLIGQVAAGQVFTETLSAGQCVRVFTGSPLPPGSDAVVMQEDTERDSSRPGEIAVLDAVRPWENVRFKGEDVKSGTPVLQAGERLAAGQIALMAALGLSAVQVGRQPTVGLLATGSELCEPGEALRAGQIHESNRVMLSALTTNAGGCPRVFPLVRDDLPATQAALASAFGECDVVVTSGGVSVGDMDLVKPALERIGGKLDFWRVAIKPGKPFVLGTCGSKLLFGLPGNPVSAFVTFLLLVQPALRQFQGAKSGALPCVTGVLSERITNQGDRRHFVRVALDRDGKVRSAGPQASHFLHSLSAANALLDVPVKAVLEAGTIVPVLLCD